jgi:hypothetical protein
MSLNSVGSELYFKLTFLYMAPFKGELRHKLFF